VIQLRISPVLEREIFERGLKKKIIAKKLKITERTFGNKLSGRTEFTWQEACDIKNSFFPDIEKDILFFKSNVHKTG
jgi:hypothetical protein